MCSTPGMWWVGSGDVVVNVDDDDASVLLAAVPGHFYESSSNGLYYHSRRDCCSLRIAKTVTGCADEPHLRPCLLCVDRDLAIHVRNYTFTVGSRGRDALQGRLSPKKVACRETKVAKRRYLCAKRSAICASRAAATVGSGCAVEQASRRARLAKAPPASERCKHTLG